MVASQKPKDLVKWIEQISGSLDYASEYEALKASSEKATEHSTFHFNKKRALAADLKALLECKQELDEYARLQGQSAKMQEDMAVLSLMQIHDRWTEVQAKLAATADTSTADVDVRVS
jgi:structural maintenance of chromosome 1